MAARRPASPQPPAPPAPRPSPRGTSPKVRPAGSPAAARRRGRPGVGLWDVRGRSTPSQVAAGQHRDSGFLRGLLFCSPVVRFLRELHRSSGAGGGSALTCCSFRAGVCHLRDLGSTGTHEGRPEAGGPAPEPVRQPPARRPLWSFFVFLFTPRDPSLCLLSFLFCSPCLNLASLWPCGYFLPPWSPRNEG